MLLSLAGLVVLVKVKSSQADLENSKPGCVFIFVLIWKLHSLWNTHTSVRDFHAPGPEQHETRLKRLQPGTKEVFGAQSLRNWGALGCLPRPRQDVAALALGPEERSEGMVTEQFIAEAPETCWELEPSAPAFAKGDFGRDAERANTFCSCHPCQAADAPSSVTCVSSRHFIHARLVPPCLQSTFCKSPLYFAGGSFESRAVQNCEDLKLSPSPI